MVLRLSAIRSAALALGLVAISSNGLAAPHSGGPLTGLSEPETLASSRAEHTFAAELPSMVLRPEGLPNAPAWSRALAELDCLELFTHTSPLEAARPLAEAEVLARFDRNHDGRLNASEHRAAEKDREARQLQRARLIQRFDANGNRRLEAIEMSRARAESVAQRRALLLARFDENGDGLLDPRERTSVALERERAARLARLVPHFDKDGNGLLNPHEKHAMAAFLAATPASASRKGDA